MSNEQDEIAASRFPHPNVYTVEGRQFSDQEIIDFLRPHITKPRQATIEKIVSQRTFNVATICESLYDRGNVCAVMRSAESLGIHPFHIIETEKYTKISNRVTRGTDKWLDIERWESTRECVLEMKRRGYKIVATHLDDTAKPISEFDFTVPTALVFGNEHRGISEEMLELSDARCIIPMSGFAQSFNISVAAAISFYHVREDRIRRQGFHNDLMPAQYTSLLADYFIRALKRPETILSLAVKAMMAQEDNS